jgi:hypothetical protein
VFLIGILFAIWALIPWLDRRAYRDRYSPGFTDFGWAAILFLTFLTLAGWDIGGGAQATDLAAMPKVARICALWTLVAGAVVIGVRYWKFEHRWFILSGAALLQVALHGLAGVSYLSAGAISLGLAIFVMATLRLLRSSGRREDTT